jgi:hypothetical protein
MDHIVMPFGKRQQGKIFTNIDPCLTQEKHLKNISRSRILVHEDQSHPFQVQQLPDAALFSRDNDAAEFLTRFRLRRNRQWFERLVLFELNIDDRVCKTQIELPCFDGRLESFEILGMTILTFSPVSRVRYSASGLNISNISTGPRRGRIPSFISAADLPGNIPASMMIAKKPTVTSHFFMMRFP